VSFYLMMEYISELFTKFFNEQKDQLI